MKAEMQQTCEPTFLKEGKQTAPLQFIEFLFSYKTQPHLGGKYLLFAASVTQKTRQMVVIDITCPCSIFKEVLFALTQTCS